MSVCVLQNCEKNRVLWTDFLASCREINRFSVSNIDPEPTKPTISLALTGIMPFFGHENVKSFSSAKAPLII